MRKLKCLYYIAINYNLNQLNINFAKKTQKIVAIMWNSPKNSFRVSFFSQTARLLFLGFKTRTEFIKFNFYLSKILILKWREDPECGPPQMARWKKKLARWIVREKPN